MIEMKSRNSCKQTLTFFNNGSQCWNNDAGSHVLNSPILNLTHGLDAHNSFVSLVGIPSIIIMNGMRSDKIKSKTF